MSDGSFKQVMNRIIGAHPSSPIAVFRSAEPGQLNAVFADTVVSQMKIAARDPELIGVFDGSMDISAVHKRLSVHVPTPSAPKRL